MSEIIRTYWLQILLAYFSFMGIFIIYRWLKTRGKIQARIKTPIGERIEWVKPSFEGDKCYVIFEKESKKKAGWKAELTNKSLIPKTSWLGLRRFYCFDIFPSATKAIEYDFTVNEASQPKWDKMTSKGYIEAKTLKQFGEGEKLIAPGVIWIVVVLCIIILIFNVLPYLGRFR